MIVESNPPAAPQALANSPQRAAVFVKLGRRRGLRATVEVTPAGLLAIGGLVSSILLSTAVLVRSAAAAKLRAEGGPEQGEEQRRALEAPAP
ncbi:MULTISPECIES: hypothetical protein [Sphingomonas]|uniref:Uncharacterized protein n=1 Tax=Sphingomonas molluscorum TaxID=418184 RepID=A0ABU8Q672_9SPHN|nr:hypothetical protein [Sphingomonas sp. JUb134]MBM7406394.1 hypothetical protein [Sphingomonas sp. JUb134]